MDFKKQKLEIEYPCIWKYKVIGEDQKKLSSAVAGVLGNQKYSLEQSNKSSAGKYISFTLETTVDSEKNRTKIFKLLNSNIHIKFVL